MQVDVEHVVGKAQAFPQEPQLAGSEVVSTSHPFVGSPSQSAKPGAQASVQALAVQVGLAFASAGHATPQPPQLAGSEVMSTSHPFVGTPSQSAKPGAQASVHTLAAQLGLAFGPPAHEMPQPPQFCGSSSVSTHPFPAQGT
jgi:hypothetical protein